MAEDHSYLLRVLDASLGEHRGRLLRPAERIAALLTSAAHVRERDEPLDAELMTLLRLIGYDFEGEPRSAPEAVRMLAASTDGSGRENLPAIMQAYARAVGRVVAAEAHAIGQLVRHAPHDDRLEVLAAALDALLSAADGGFGLLHRRLLHDALRAELAGDGCDAPASDDLAVGMVDFVGSTRHLLRATREELEQLVYLLFEGAQHATAERGARVVKYVGDGVFLTGHDIREIAGVVFRPLRRLSNERFTCDASVCNLRQGIDLPEGNHEIPTAITANELRGGPRRRLGRDQTGGRVSHGGLRRPARGLRGPAPSR